MQTIKEAAARVSELKRILADLEHTCDILHEVAIADRMLAITLANDGKTIASDVKYFQDRADISSARWKAAWDVCEAVRNVPFERKQDRG